MIPFRIIPVLLLDGSRLVKTVKFKKPSYVGDPRNAVKILNDKEVDELVLLDISATREGKTIQLQLIREIASECFMPLCYGGGITREDEVQSIVQAGVEKVAVNTMAVEDPAFVRRAAGRFGSSTIVVSFDVKKSLLGTYELHVRGGRVNTGKDPRYVAELMQRMGAGEILLNSVDRDGTMQGYDVGLIRSVAEAVDIPVIACGGAGRIEDFAEAVYDGKASAVAAGSYFVFHGKHRAVLISYPDQSELQGAMRKDWT